MGNRRERLLQTLPSRASSYPHPAIHKPVAPVMLLRRISFTCETTCKRAAFDAELARCGCDTVIYVGDDQTDEDVIAYH